ncbi:MAG: tRNA (guanosine(37)-N1)-methyltransferase TrmD [Candidatus Niyogibacteria bacterium CG10_big_fil_rev_8_21_14_0_10_46_36]|uniref:tRNA (guanine-N(1)-)-methyltransferase n=1 Tax=Candidatus Niyogibacteria bacterium CG10_big_fil_rev_8_21_14_0_10_46_36 TaxID=1974726 RepID=A0A2H0TEZ2_9BACT|nr:MAG: tRNA (guanosine(37)-N1)-methyltransferase TrmD [Candidatus Niyogibacteria bacterium CG10_big_fil_rev_8_21_14_0_10_46_36]
MRFDIITIFPRLFDPYIHESILKRAQKKKLVDIRLHDLRDFTKDTHKKVDDKAYGGGPGMVLKAEPILKAVIKAAQKNKKPLVIFTSATGKQFNAELAKKLSKQKQLIIIAGRYEGIDERAKKALRTYYTVQEISAGPYVLTGGELPALILIDAISRHIPGVLGKNESIEETRGGIGIPAYTRPEAFIFKKKPYQVPNILLSGDHKKIHEWRKRHIKRPTNIDKR